MLNIDDATVQLQTGMPKIDSVLTTVLALAHLQINCAANLVV